MARIPESVKEEIKNRLFLPELVDGAGVRLKRRGREWRGVCPFEPSSSNPTKFRVFPNRYECFGCGRSGDVFTWLSEHEGLSFRDAIRRAAELAHVDMSPYERQAAALTPADRLRQACAQMLSDLADLSFAQALQVPAADRVWQGLDVNVLLQAGEIGRLPSLEETRNYLRAKGHGPEAFRATGLSRSLPELSGRWVVWARRRSRLAAVRPLGSDGPVAGERGARSRGWTVGGGPFANLGAGRFPLLTTDDVLYVALRAAGVQGVHLPSGTEGIETATHMDIFRDRARPPLLLTRAEAAARRRAFEDALRLLPANPRLRVAELATAPGDPVALVQELERAEARAGMVIDWQGELLVRFDGLASDEARERAARRLLRVVDATESTVEKAACAMEIEWLTGIAPSRLPPRLDVGRAHTMRRNPTRSGRRV